MHSHTYKYSCMHACMAGGMSMCMLLASMHCCYNLAIDITQVHHQTRISYLFLSAPLCTTTHCTARTPPSVTSFVCSPISPIIASKIYVLYLFILLAGWWGQAKIKKRRILLFSFCTQSLHPPFAASFLSAHTHNKPLSYISSRRKCEYLIEEWI